MQGDRSCPDAPPAASLSRLEVSMGLKDASLPQAGGVRSMPLVYGLTRKRHVHDMDTGADRVRPSPERTERPQVAFSQAHRKSDLPQLMCDTDRDPGRAILIAGAPRSTTWLAEVLATSLRARTMFEPFHARLVPEFGSYVPFLYRAPYDRDDVLLASCLRVFDGSLRNRWVDKNVSTVRPRCRVVKVVRANLMLAWLDEQFPAVRTLFVLRHPCAVVLS